MTTEQLRERQSDLKLEIRHSGKAIEAAEIERANARLKVDSPYGRAPTEKEREELRKAEAACLTLQHRREDVEAELAQIGAELARRKAAEVLEQAKAERAAKIAALSESRVAEAERILAEREAALSSVQAEHSALLERVKALKAKASAHDAELKANAREHAQALARGAEPPALLPRLDYAAVLKACADEIELSQKRIAKAAADVAEAERQLLEARASDAYAAVYAALAPVLDALPPLPLHPECWNGIMQVQSHPTVFSITLRRPGA